MSHLNVIFFFNACNGLTLAMPQMRPKLQGSAWAMKIRNFWKSQRWIGVKHMNELPQYFKSIKYHMSSKLSG